MLQSLRSKISIHNFLCKTFNCRYLKYNSYPLTKRGLSAGTAKIAGKKINITEKIVPVVSGTTFLIRDFNRSMLFLVVGFIINLFIILPLFSRKYGCADFPQKDGCPWMRQKQKAKRIAAAIDYLKRYD